MGLSADVVRVPEQTDEPDPRPGETLSVVAGPASDKPPATNV